MKKFLALTLSIIIIIICSACTGIKNEIKASIPSNGISTFENELDTEINNNDKYNNCIYLTNRFFFFTTEDTDPSNSFGTPTKLLKYDLHSGAITSILDFPTSEIMDLTLIGSKLYFITYTNTNTDWGFCLFSYDIEDETVDRIYETPNTVDWIYMSSIGDKLFYMCSTMTQDEENSFDTNAEAYVRYQLHMISNNEDQIIKDNINCKYADLLKEDNNIYINLYFDGAEEAYIINEDGEINTSSEIKETEKNDYNDDDDTEKIKGKLVSGKFGRYYILQDKVLDLYNGDTDSCGYRYSINYYIYDTENKEEKMLSPAFYWYYYI